MTCKDCSEPKGLIAKVIYWFSVMKMRRIMRQSIKESKNEEAN